MFHSLPGLEVLSANVGGYHVLPAQDPNPGTFVFPTVGQDTCVINATASIGPWQSQTRTCGYRLVISYLKEAI